MGAKISLFAVDVSIGMGHSSIGVGGSRDGGSNRGVVRNHSDSSDTGDDSTVGQTSSHLANGVGAGLGFPLAIVDTVVKSGDSSGVVDGGGGIADNRGGGDNGSVSGAVTSVNEGEGSTISLTCGDLAQGVGLGLPLAIVDTVVKGGDSGGVADNRGGIVEGAPANLGHSSLGGVGDDTDVVKTTLSQGILGGGSSGDLGHGPGLGVSRDSHDGQAELKWVLCKILSLSETS